jgi:hypothetical protein
MLRILILLLFSSISFSQTISITGVVSDVQNKPLESANVIAKPLQEGALLKFAIADNKGRYRIELEKTVKYEITVSYIGYGEEVFILESNSNINTHDFKLKETGQQLKEIVIKHEFKPIIIKKDTLVYDVKSFANGNERKMKEVLEKLPGVEVDKNGDVTVQGKKVTKMLVEGKSFFGGGSKLAIENIPADALDKIEVIDHFNEVGFMKKVSDSEDLAMNVKLKEDKKKFVFGDIEAGKGNDKYYLAHAALFYYSPKTNISFIGDANNIGKSTFTYQDLLRFGGGASSYLNNRKSLTNLNSFVNDNHDVVQNKSQFGALNFSHDISEKLVLSGYSLFSKVLMTSQIDNDNEYLQNSTYTFEKTTQKNNDQSLLGIGNIKLDYSGNKNEKWYYNTQYQFSNNNMLNTLNSITNTNNSLYETVKKSDNAGVKQFLEWHNNINDNHTTTLVINHTFEQSKPQNNWLTDQKFLTGLIPIQDDTNYNIQQIKKIRNNAIDAIFKHYWIINNFNHLYTIIGNNHINSNFETSEKQILTNGSINGFENAGFGNNVKYFLNDAYVGIEYKFKIGKLTNKPGIYSHWYQLNTVQNTTINLSKNLIQPQWNSELEFNQSEKLIFNYKLLNNFPEVGQLANNFTLQSYNAVFKGNALLSNEQYHNANILYSKMNMYRGTIYFASANYNKKTKTIRNQIEISGIDQYNTPIITNNPETNIQINCSFSKKIYRFSIGFNSNLNWFSYIQTLNNITTSNDRNNQNIGIQFKTVYKKWPLVSVGYNKGFSEFKGITTTQYRSEGLNTNFEMEILDSWEYKMSYQNLKNFNNAGTNFYEIANISLSYQKKNNPFSFEFTINNLFNTTSKNNYSFSDYKISQQTTYILPRIMLFSVSYKL